MELSDNVRGKMGTSNFQETKELPKRKVIVIGLDGATFDLIKPWVEQGRLPNIAKLMKTGVYDLYSGNFL